MRHLLLCLLLVTATSALSAQSLRFSIEDPGPGPFRDAHPCEVFDLTSGAVNPWIPHETWRVLFGDRDGDRRLDDAPANVDALHDLGLGFGGMLFSLDQDTTFPGQPTIKDGDVFSFDARGLPLVRHAESEFALWTSTTTIDVDAYCELADGSVVFSFADDEVTTDAALIAANGGQAMLDEQCVFLLAPGMTSAALHLTPAQVAAIFATALNRSVTTVVDVNGLALDPLGGPRDLLLSSASTAQALRGRIVSTRGVVWMDGGQAFEPSRLGFAATAIIDALDTGTTQLGPQLRSSVLSGSASAGGAGQLRVSGLTPGAAVQLVMTIPTAAPRAIALPGSLGVGQVWHELADPMWITSWSARPWLLIAGADGVATYDFNFLGRPANQGAVIGAVELGSFALSLPIAVHVDI